MSLADPLSFQHGCSFQDTWISQLPVHIVRIRVDLSGFSGAKAVYSLHLNSQRWYAVGSPLVTATSWTCNQFASLGDDCLRLRTSNRQ